tara:strand:+ start:175 stop:525 length:351 start_codon:yes stop_codon:yes gene_type:complete
MKVIGLSPNSLVKLIAAYYTGAELEACKYNIMPDEDEMTAECIHTLMTGIYLLNEDARCSVTSAPHIVHNDQSGFIVHSTYPDDGKLYPQTRLTVVSEGITILDEFANQILVPATE